MPNPNDPTSWQSHWARRSSPLHSIYSSAWLQIHALPPSLSQVISAPVSCEQENIQFVFSWSERAAHILSSYPSSSQRPSSLWGFQSDNGKHSERNGRNKRTHPVGVLMRTMTYQAQSFHVRKMQSHAWQMVESPTDRWWKVEGTFPSPLTAVWCNVLQTALFSARLLLKAVKALLPTFKQFIWADNQSGPLFDPHEWALLNLTSLIGIYWSLISMICVQIKNCCPRLVVPVVIPQELVMGHMSSCSPHCSRGQ